MVVFFFSVCLFVSDIYELQIILGLTVRRGRRRRRERRVYLLVIVAGGHRERVAVVRGRDRGRGGRRRPVVMVVPCRGVRVQRADVVVREKRVHVVGHVVGHQRFVAARRRRTAAAGRRFVPAPVVRVVMVVMMRPGTADHFHAGSHFHAALRRDSAGENQQKKKKNYQIYFTM